MKYLFLLLILAKCAFIAVPEIRIMPFPFAVGTMREVSLFTYVWALIDIAAIFIVALISWLLLSGKINPTKERITAVGGFMLVCGFDLLDYLIRGNSEWFYLGNYPVTNNVFMIPLYWVITWE